MNEPYFQRLAYNLITIFGRESDDLKFRGIGMGVKQDFRCCYEHVSNCNYYWLEANIA
jgi:hypothetical protein